MADVRLYIDGQMIIPEVGKDMLSMVGWSDSSDVKYCTKKRENWQEINKFIPVDTVLDSDRYLGYFGDEDVTLAISRNRNISIAINLKKFELEGTEGYDYFIRTYYFSDMYTELDIDSVELTVHRVNKDWLHMSWKYEDVLFEADISTYL